MHRYARSAVLERIGIHTYIQARNVSNPGATMNGETSRDAAASTWTLRNYRLEREREKEREKELALIFWCRVCEIGLFDYRNFHVFNFA